MIGIKKGSIEVVRKNKKHQCLIVLGWIILWCVIIDAGINLIFSYPSNTHTKPSKLQDYFEYGRSVEGKLERMTRPNKEDSSPRVRGGWLNSNKHESLPKIVENPDEILVAFYGMSHTEQLWKAIHKIDNKFIIRGSMAAGAPPNWSYAAYEIDRGRHKADAVVLGILTDSVAPIAATTGMTAFFDSAYPYTFPHYTVMDGIMLVSKPPFLDVQGYIDNFYDKHKWDQYRKWLGANDRYYNPLLFRKSIFDHSALFRLFRRAYADKIKNNITKSIYQYSGFVEDSDEVASLRAIVRQFAITARQDNIVPIVFIVNSKFRSNHLYEILKPTLNQYNISHLSTHTICPPDDPSVYLTENSHFTPEKDIELAKEMIDIITLQVKNR